VREREIVEGFDQADVGNVGQQTHDRLPDVRIQMNRVHEVDATIGKLSGELTDGQAEFAEWRAETLPSMRGD